MIFRILTGIETLNLLRLYALLGLILFFLIAFQQKYSTLRKQVEQKENRIRWRESQYYRMNSKLSRYERDKESRTKENAIRSTNNARLLKILEEQLIDLRRKVQHSETKLRFLNLLPLSRVKKYLHRVYGGKGLIQDLSIPEIPGSIFGLIRTHLGHAPDDGLILFHGTDIDSRRSLVQKGIDATFTVNKAYGDGFYVSPSINTALAYARDRFQNRRMSGNRDRGFTPVLMVYRIRSEFLKTLRYPIDIGGNTGTPITDHLVIRPSAILYLEPVECIIIENLIQTSG